MGERKIQLPTKDQEVTRETFSFQVDKAKLEATEQRDGHYLLRSNLTGEDPAVLWTRYVQLTQIESVFRSLKSELGIRPLYHQLAHRADAHVLIAFLAYCLQVTLKNRLMMHAPGLTPAAVFEKLFFNLITNALEAMPHGGKIRIGARKADNCVLIEVEDTGPGIPRGIQARLFEPFVSAGKDHGLGLGLALSRQAVLDHGGDIWLEAARGARFVISLPLKQPEDRALHRRGLQREEKSGART